ncbi:MAG: hypothetical protein GWO41_16810 [candidate division Zixibacteria bacterium]|nr:hypothetical protein [candidate division Zixibacteria bacterium]NIR66429.1 hypothetical protein [candidate division Zixibacteria bacterium]NIS18073.1 hypothetical protein [candidate division Zixibacteria bacterium]NIS48019.1 hypothetical protein [candidate division Zixibacteria bacterium]NIT54353.1 hypothetical protein [candidate division Zixibacteria bacterium]
MKKLTVAALAVLLVVGLSTTGSAQFFMSQLSDARVIGSDEVQLGGAFSVFDNMLGLGGFIRIGVINELEVGGKLGFVNFDNNFGDDHTGLTLGIDMLYQFLDTEYGDPVDLSTGGAIEYYDYPADFSLLMFGSNTLVSYPVEFEGGQVLSPFFRLNLRFDRVANGVDDTEFELGFGFGARFDITQYFGFFGEIIIAGGAVDEGFVGGVTFGI